MSAAAFSRLARFARETLARGERAALAHLVRVEGSHYARVGARAVLAEGGGSAGAISAGCLEADLAVRIPALHETKRAALVEYDLSAGDDSVWGLGLGCGGRIAIRLVPLDEGVAGELEAIAQTLSNGRVARVETVLPNGDRLMEEIDPPVSLLVCGAGPDAPPLARQGLLLGWSVQAASSRIGAAAARRFQELGVAVRPPKEIVRLARRPRTVAVVMTHGFLDDLEMLARLAGAPLAYLGVLGPRERTHRLLLALDADGVRVGPLHAPAGLDVGAESPEEIALAIVAEIQACIAGRPGGFLRDRAGAIHAPVQEIRGRVSADCR